MKKKYKIMYPSDYWDAAKRGKPYIAQADSMVVMSGSGVFFLVQDVKGYHPCITKLSEILGKYDVVWKND